MGSATLLAGGNVKDRWPFCGSVCARAFPSTTTQVSYGRLPVQCGTRWGLLHSPGSWRLFSDFLVYSLSTVDFYPQNRDRETDPPLNTDGGFLCVTGCLEISAYKLCQTEGAPFAHPFGHVVEIWELWKPRLDSTVFAKLCKLFAHLGFLIYKIVVDY